MSVLQFRFDTRPAPTAVRHCIGCLISTVQLRDNDLVTATINLHYLLPVDFPRGCGHIKDHYKTGC